MKFTRTYEIGTSALTPNLKAPPSEIFDLLQLTATLHSHEIGYTMDYLTTEQKGWALLFWQAEFEKLPKWMDIVTVETWATSYQKLIATRNFRVLDANGDTIARVLSKWVYMSISKHRPVAAPSDMMDKYFSTDNNILIEERFIVPELNKKISESTFMVQRSHTDSNHHVNNVNYIVWAEDGIPDDIFYNNDIKKLHVKYRKEASVGTTITSETYMLNDSEYVCLIKSGDIIHAEVSMTFGSSADV